MKILLVWKNANFLAPHRKLPFSPGTSSSASRMVETLHWIQLFLLLDCFYPAIQQLELDTMITARDAFALGSLKDPAIESPEL